MIRSLFALALALAFATGCATNSRNIPMSNTASLRVESQRMWTRPTEVGYSFGPEITGTATQSSFLGFQTGESKPGGTSVLAIVSSLSGAGAGLGGVSAHAAYNAVESRPGAEGIYVTRVATESHGFLLFWRSSTSIVTGRALTLRDLGMIDAERADEARFLGHGPDVVVIKEGRVDLSLPGVEVK